jgi:hypothetical protein
MTFCIARKSLDPFIVKGAGFEYGSTTLMKGKSSAEQMSNYGQVCLLTVSPFAGGLPELFGASLPSLCDPLPASSTAAS